MAKTGRPREFVRDEAIEQAMHLFWQHGYEATSLAQLRTAMGHISSASFYAAFGSKEKLFRNVLDYYLRTHGQVVAPLQDVSFSPRAAVERTLRGSARMQTDTAHPLGCLVALSTAAWSLENHHLQAVLAAERQHNRDALRACVERAVKSGELSAGTDVAALAAVFDTFLAGLATQAHDGIPLAILDASISAVLGVWDGHAKQPAAGSKPGRIAAA